MINVDNSN